MVLNAGTLIVRASVAAVGIVACVCYAIDTPTFIDDDPRLSSKLGFALVNLAMMATTFTVAFSCGLASHNLQHSSYARIALHYIVIEVTYWAYHNVQHALPFVGSATRHAVHHSVGVDDVPLSPLDAWVMHPFDFLGWSACAVVPNIFAVTRLHAKQHQALLTLLAVLLMMQHSPVWVACTDAGCVGHVVHHASGRVLDGLPSLFGTGVNSLLLGV